MVLPKLCPSLFFFIKMKMNGKSEKSKNIILYFLNAKTDIFFVLKTFVLTDFFVFSEHFAFSIKLTFCVVFNYLVTVFNILYLSSLFYKTILVIQF